MNAGSPPATWKTLLAFAIIYFVWGSTFLAIRTGVLEIPPLLMAAMRFVVAGAVMLAWAFARRERLPTAKQWASISFLAFLIFVVDYGLLFWAEIRVPSGIAAVVMATIPAFIALGEVAFLRTQRLTPALVAALLIGFAGVGVLVVPAAGFGGAPVYGPGVVALVVGSLAWAAGSISTRKLPLPDSKPLSSGAQMFVGGLMLTVASTAAGEWRGFHLAAVSAAAWFSVAYLIVFGSIIGFTAYVWLIHHQSPTRVGTYAYVNPVVAVLCGYLFAGEPMGMRTVLGTALVLVSVVVIALGKPRAPEQTPQE